ncbi:hypothetical protein EDEG_03124 [Edhazardia aedis USNM 41457]|uniref:Uncharacterized protein n=1 Tax=Edhazardia aedis (strain USNM 41457) TaxID=1003232 RepID=J9D3P0_EDHAE|nr:hypothetical protein EDEG_03124 [Edhazardia aedis USNM 41457]|eukprot:EJW02451.1 hypothetical protein EDEG_03124 [Edhazardia aedis USNM 41457]
MMTFECLHTKILTKNKKKRISKISMINYSFFHKQTAKKMRYLVSNIEWIFRSRYYSKFLIQCYIFISVVGCSIIDKEKFLLPKIFGTAYQNLTKNISNVVKNDNSILSISLKNTMDKNNVLRFLDDNILSDKMKEIFKCNTEFKLTILHLNLDDIFYTNDIDKSRLLDSAHNEITKKLHEENIKNVANNYFYTFQKMYKITELKRTISNMVKSLFLNENHVLEENLEKCQIPLLDAANNTKIRVFSFISFDYLSYFDIETLLRTVNLRANFSNEYTCKKFFYFIGHLRNKESSLTNYTTLCQHFMKYNFLGSLYYYKPWSRPQERDFSGYIECSNVLDENGNHTYTTDSISFLSPKCFLQQFMLFLEENIDFLYRNSQYTCFYSSHNLNVMSANIYTKSLTNEEITGSLEMYESIVKCSWEPRKFYNFLHKFKHPSEDFRNILIHHVFYEISAIKKFRYCKLIRFADINGEIIPIPSNENCKQIETNYSNFIQFVTESLYKLLYSFKYNCNAFNPSKLNNSVILVNAHHEIHNTNILLSYKDYKITIKRVINNILLEFLKHKENCSFRFYYGFIDEHSNFPSEKKNNHEQNNIFGTPLQNYFDQNHKIVKLEKKFCKTFIYTENIDASAQNLNVIEFVQSIIKYVDSTLNDNPTQKNDIILDFGILNDKRYVFYLKYSYFYGIEVSFSEAVKIVFIEIIEYLKKIVTENNEVVLKIVENNQNFLYTKLNTILIHIFNIFMENLYLKYHVIEDYIDKNITLNDLNQMITNSSLYEHIQNQKRGGVLHKNAPFVNYCRKTYEFREQLAENEKLIKKAVTECIFQVIYQCQIEVKTCVFFLDNKYTDEINRKIRKINECLNSDVFTDSG